MERLDGLVSIPQEWHKKKVSSPLRKYNPFLKRFHTKPSSSMKIKKLEIVMSMFILIIAMRPISFPPNQPLVFFYEQIFLVFLGLIFPIGTYLISNRSATAFRFFYFNWHVLLTLSLQASQDNLKINIISKLKMVRYLQCH